MPETSNNSHSCHKRYYLAKAGKRITCRIVEECFLYFCTALIVVLFFATDHLVNQTELWKFSRSWLYGVCFSCVMIFLSFYLLVLPTFCHGQTLIKKFFHLRYRQQNKKKSLFCSIFLHELFIHYLFYFFSLVLAIYLSCLDIQEANTFFKRSWGKETQNIDILFRCLFSVTSLIQMILLISLIYHNGRCCLVDSFSHLVVVDLTKKVQVKETSFPPKQEIDLPYNLPGDISQDELKKLSK